MMCATKRELEKELRLKILELEFLIAQAEKNGLSIYIKYQTHSPDFDIENERRIFTKIQTNNSLKFTTYKKGE